MTRPFAAPFLAASVRRLVTMGTAAAAAVLITGQAASAQSAPTQSAPPTATIRFDEAGALALTSPYGPADVGRLRATFLSLPGTASANQAVDVFCLDFNHIVSFDPSGWNVYTTNLGSSSLAYTRQGERTFADAPSDALTRYRKAAWLVDQYASVSTRTDTTGIQVAMWRQFVSTLAPYSYANAAEADASASWLAAADTFATSAAFDSYNWSRFTVLTDVNAVGTGQFGPGYQEFITASAQTTTPEPTTFLLLGASLTGLAFVARRRTVR